MGMTGMTETNIQQRLTSARDIVLAWRDERLVSRGLFTGQRYASVRESELDELLGILDDGEDDK